MTPNSEMKNPKPCTEVRVKREVIENQLLAALDDKSKVAILASKEDLELIISALLPMWSHTKAMEMHDDLQQLLWAAFPTPTQGTK